MNHGTQNSTIGHRRALAGNPELGLKAGQVGTVVEVFGEDDFEVEFVDKKGHTIALLPLKGKDVLVLQYEPVSVP